MVRFNRSMNDVFNVDESGGREVLLFVHFFLCFPCARRWQQSQLFPTSTRATRLTALQAITRLPSAVAIMLRTTPPPDGINQV